MVELWGFELSKRAHIDTEYSPAENIEDMSSTLLRLAGSVSVNSREKTVTRAAGFGDRRFGFVALAKDSKPTANVLIRT